MSAPGWSWEWDREARRRMVLRTVKCVTACGALLLAWSLGTPTVEARWADQAVAEIKVEAAQARISFTALAMRHILTGHDHMLFLVSLVMLGGGLRSLLKTVTAFTVAHSVTLSLAALGIATLPPRLVESGIALSIAYVAAENLWRGAHAIRTRWFVTFSFGLIHGLGFATILRQLAISRANLALSLVSFNFGVELGQIAVVTAALLSLGALATLPWESTMRRRVSAAAAALGVVWFIQRALLG